MQKWWFVTGILSTALLAGCSSTSSSSATGNAFQTFVSPCKADATGVCYAQEKRVPDDAEWKTLQAEIRGMPQEAVDSPSNSQRSSIVTEKSSPTDSASVTIHVIGGEHSSSSSSSRNSFSGSRSGYASVLVHVDGRTVFASSLNRSSSSAIARDVNGNVIVGRTSNSRCPRSRSFLNLFGEDELTKGSQGWTFPVLLNGDCPVTAAILKYGDNQGGFGGSLSLGD